MMKSQSDFLEIKDLTIRFYTYKSIVRVIEGFNLSMKQGSTLGIVGESGCGKSVTALSIMGLIPSPPGEITSGEIWLQGENLLKKSEEQMRQLRGKRISMIFQDPMTSLNPVFTIGDQIITVIRTHQQFRRSAAFSRAVEMLNRVGLPDPSTLLKKYPHELSGGMCQRVMIAMAIACQPSLLIADEPTTALDVTIQAQILNLMNRLKSEDETTIMLITHDLGVVAKMCDKVAVMYAGRVVEYGNTRHILKTPKHPYTQGLLASTPIMGESKQQLKTIEGVVANLANPPDGCRFNPRCSYSKDACRKEVPDVLEIGKDHWVNCYLY